MAANNLVGQTLGGRYQIESVIGQGGMAGVYKANDPNLRRTVAIKVIHTYLSNNAEFFRRFEEEAAVIARLRHPNIVQVYDFAHDGDLYYMVMEYVLGETLQTRLKRLNQARRHLPVKDVIRYAIDICEAAYYAHQRGTIHRDIKPANVMLDVNGKAILMDFGIARIVGGHEHTATGAVLGTALYMAPEQIQGLHADARADIYSLGVTLFEMVSGKPPFEADSAMTLMMMHLNDPVPDVREIQPEAPLDLVAVINKALAKNRDERFQSALEMAAALRQILDRMDKATREPVASVSAPPPVPAIDATMVETPIRAEAPARVEPGATMIETAGVPLPATTSQPRGRATGPQTLKPAAQPATAQTAPASRPPAAIAVPATPAETAYPVQRRRGNAWMPILILVVIALLAVGGYLLYPRLFPAERGGVMPSATAPGIAVIEPTNTLELVATQAEATATLLPAIPTDTLAPIPTNTREKQAVPTFTSVYTATEAPTATLPPTETPTATVASVVIGGADKIAYFNGGNVWVVNLDGSDLQQLTNDTAKKSYLRWLPDGQGVTYITGKCIHLATLAGEDKLVTCFNNATYLESFEPSPDGTQVVISVDHQLFLVPFDLDKLSKATSRQALTDMATCQAFAPYKRNFARYVRWSKDGSVWAVLVIGVLPDNRRGDMIDVFSINRCIPDPMVTRRFPGTLFSYKGYDANPVIQDFTWDGGDLVVFHGWLRNDGYGDLHVFNMTSAKPYLAINPMGRCCYRDPQWSPDNLYLLFAFQDMSSIETKTVLYYIQYASIGSGATYTPLPLPEITDPVEWPSPVLRPVRTP